MSPDTGDRRTWLAILFSIALPGAGHLYVRAWLRALPWLVLDFALAVWIIAVVPIPTTLSVEAILEASRAIPLQIRIAKISMAVVAALDVYLIVRTDAIDPVGSSGLTCPSCGKDLDDFEDIEFCPWCAERLE